MFSVSSVLSSTNMQWQVVPPRGSDYAEGTLSNIALTDDGGVAHHSDNSLVNKDLFIKATVSQSYDACHLNHCDRHLHYPAASYDQAQQQVTQPAR